MMLSMILAALLSSADAPRAIWIWEHDAFRMLDNARFKNETVDFLRKRNVTEIYLYADSYRGRNILTDEPQKYRNLLADMHEKGFKVQALLGSMYLRTQEYILPEKRAEAVAMFEAVLKFNASSDTDCRFDGINVDIEPHLLSDWRSERTLRATQYLELSAEFMRMKKRAGSAARVGPAMPFWFDGIEISWNGKKKPLNEHTQDIYDYVAIMDYRNFAAGSDGIIAHAKNELDYADSISKHVVIGIETGRSDPPKVTFFGKSLAVMETELELARAAFMRHPSFAGFAIHHLRPYREK